MASIRCCCCNVRICSALADFSHVREDSDGTWRPVRKGVCAGSRGSGTMEPMPINRPLRNPRYAEPLVQYRLDGRGDGEVHKATRGFAKVVLLPQTLKNRYRSFPCLLLSLWSS